MRDWMKIRMEFSKQFQQQEIEVKNPYVFDPKVDKIVWRKPTPLPKVNYQGGDTAQFIHNNKTHRTASEAFRDADYATGLWRCESEWDRVKDSAGWIAMWIVTLGGLYLLATWFNRVVA